MSAFPPPNVYFNGIIYDSDYFTQSSSGSGLTKAQANALYLQKTISDTATALETFNGITNYGTITVADNGTNGTYMDALGLQVTGSSTLAVGTTNNLPLSVGTGTRS